MEREKDTLKALVEYLTAHGYPSNSFVLEYPAGRRRADLAVVDPDTKELVAIFELKRERNPQSEKFGRQQLASYLSEIGNPAIPAYLVFDAPGTPPFEIERVRFDEPDQNLKEKYMESPPDFQLLKASRRSTVVAEKKEQKKIALDKFMLICFVCAFISGVLFLMDLFSSFEMTEAQLLLLGATIALVIIPFAGRLKILGVEFERLEKKS